MSRNRILVTIFAAALLLTFLGEPGSVVVSAQAPALNYEWNKDRISDWFEILGEPLPDAIHGSELREIFVSTMAADMAWMRREFTAQLPGPLPIDLFCLCASDDRLATWDLMSKWQHYTTGKFLLARIPGGHLHIVSNPDPVINFVVGLVDQPYAYKLNA